MNIFLIIAMILANITAVAIVYQFIKKLEQKEKIIFIAIGIAFMYVLISIVYWFSGFGIDKTIHEASKNFVLYLFVPVNVILFIPYFASQYMKLKVNQIKIAKFVNKLSTMAILLILVLVVEYFYFRNIQENINNMQNSIVEETQIQNEINKNIINNEIESNEFKNETNKNNVISNEVKTNKVLEHNTEFINEV